MSRSGYSDSCENWSLICWRGAVASAIRGQRGQQLLRDLLAALDALPDKRLIAGALEDNGEYCALGALGTARHIDLRAIDPDDRDQVAEAFDIASALAAEIAFENDEGGRLQETPEQRWSRMRAWVAENLRKAAGGNTPMEATP
jgi:hypothetical protein